jgi:hypothetical protein
MATKHTNKRNRCDCLDHCTASLACEKVSCRSKDFLLFVGEGDLSGVVAAWAS